jgi:CO dehydrogenase maturation factor
MFAVVEPYYKSLETGRRMALLAKDLGLERVGLIANKIRDGRELEAVSEFALKHDLEVAGVVPFDERFPEAERAGVSPLDIGGGVDSPGIVAIEEIARRLVGDE